jgi:hypothetical protein
MENGAPTDRPMTQEEFAEFVRALQSQPSPVQSEQPEGFSEETPIRYDDGQGIRFLTVEDAQKIMDESCENPDDVFVRNYNKLRENKATVVLDAADFLVLASLAGQYMVTQAIAQSQMGVPIPYSRVSKEAIDKSLEKLKRLKKKYDLSVLHDVVLTKDENGNAIAIEKE